jgi:hypothetical protein
MTASKDEQMKRAFVVTAGPSGINLSMVGIPASLQGLRPTGGYFPPKFNRDGKPHWQRMFEDPIFDQDMRALGTADAWAFAVRTYMEICDREGVNPFPSRRDPAINNGVRKVLMSRRQELVRYVDRTRLLTAVRVDPLSARHSYEITRQGNLRISASVQFEMADRDALIAFLRGPARMFHNGDGGYRRNLLKTLVVSVTNIRSKRARLNYEIELSPVYFVPEDRTTKKARHLWFDREFFNPMIRGLRFSSVQRRIKF